MGRHEPKIQESVWQWERTCGLSPARSCRLVCWVIVVSLFLPVSGWVTVKQWTAWLWLCRAFRPSPEECPEAGETASGSLWQQGPRQAGVRLCLQCANLLLREGGVSHLLWEGPIFNPLCAFLFSPTTVLRFLSLRYITIIFTLLRRLVVVLASTNTVGVFSVFIAGFSAFSDLWTGKLTLIYMPFSSDPDLKTRKCSCLIHLL